MLSADRVRDLGSDTGVLHAMRQNLALQMLEEEGETLGSWMDHCVDFCENLEQWAELKGIKLARVVLDGNMAPWPWAFHSVCMDADGYVHDIYIHKPMLLRDYIMWVYPSYETIEYQVWDWELGDFTEPTKLG